MVDSLNETYLSDVHSRTTDEEQTSFEEFIDEDDQDKLGTTIAVVSDPTGGITEVCDEYVPELGMPENELNNFRAVRSSMDFEDDLKCHNKAVDATNIDEKYREHITTDKDAVEEIKNIAERLNNGEVITLVCFEKSPKWCHRHMLKEEIIKKAEELRK